jgi:cytochrome c peroxidase
MNSRYKLMSQTIILAIIFFTLVGCGSSSNETVTTKAELGELIFSDKNLSFNRTQSCSTCHQPNNGFVDSRENNASINGLSAAASLGDNGFSIGDRNAPTAAYAAFTPEFTNTTRERIGDQGDNGDYTGYVGGQFWDGRALNLTDQAGSPPINSVEMGMASKADTIDRLRENENYLQKFTRIYGADIFDDPNLAYLAMTEVIAEFEKTDQFSPYDSKYDRSLTGDYNYSVISKASVGKTLFFSSDFNCTSCHQLKPRGQSQELFSGFEYHNLGVPENTNLRSFNGALGPDLGLFNNAAVAGDTNQKGKFKTPTLRNVAVTAPYMHNGVFQSIEAVLSFYQHAKMRASKINNSALINNVINPETGVTFLDPEVNENISHDLLSASDNDLTPQIIEQFECFLLSLTDQRYESLLDPIKISECGL